MAEAWDDRAIILLFHDLKEHKFWRFEHVEILPCRHLPHSIAESECCIMVAETFKTGSRQYILDAGIARPFAASKAFCLYTSGRLHRVFRIRNHFKDIILRIPAEILIISGNERIIYLARLVGMQVYGDLMTGCQDFLPYVVATSAVSNGGVPTSIVYIITPSAQISTS